MGYNLKTWSTTNCFTDTLKIKNILCVVNKQLQTHFFMLIKNSYDENQIISLFDNYEISKLDINRIYRYIDKYIKEDAADIVDKEIEMEMDNDVDIDLEM